MNNTIRVQNLERLADLKIGIDQKYYITYKSFHIVLFEYLKKYSKGKLLDIGCGNKPYYSIVAPFIEDYVGCDIIQSSGEVVDILCEATDIPLETESFDTIISTQTIEHVADHQKLINEAYRILKTEGYFIISGPMYWPLHEEPYDFFRFTKYGFRHILEMAGFKVVEEKANGGKWALCGQVIIHTLLPELYTRKTFSWRIFRKIMNLFGGIKIINKLFIKLDEKYYDDTNTLNYVFVARK